MYWYSERAKRYVSGGRKPRCPFIPARGWEQASPMAGGGAPGTELEFSQLVLMGRVRFFPKP